LRYPDILAIELHFVWGEPVSSHIYIGKVYHKIIHNYVIVLLALATMGDVTQIRIISICIKSPKASRMG
jgi:hypothetical protein